jgi:sugar lactone lactonase YvrE
MSDRKSMSTALSALSILLGCATVPFLAAEGAQAGTKSAAPELLQQKPSLNSLSLKQKQLPSIIIFKQKIPSKPVSIPKSKAPTVIDRVTSEPVSIPKSKAPTVIDRATIERMQIAGQSRSDLGWTYLFTPDYLGQKVHIRVLSATTGTGTLNNTTTDKAEIATPNCNPNSVVATQSTLYVACNKDIGNSDKILAYDIKNIAQPTLSKTITLDDKQFSRLMALALDSGGNLWFSSYGMRDAMGNDVTAKIARISSSSLASASPQVDKALVNSPSEPVGIAFDPDGSLWVAGTYEGGIVVNISTADLNKTGLNIDANPRYCISKSISGCNPIASSFDAPEGIAVLNGTIWVSSNGGNHPGHKMTALQVSGGKLTVKQTVGNSPGNPFSCPGGLFSDGKDLYINDQSFGLTSTGCGNGDGKATVDGVIKYGGGNLSSAPTVFKNTTSRPGFGGIAVLKIQ